VFSHIYQSNRSPSKVAGYRARAARIGLAVDNFFAEKIFNDFNERYTKSLESCVFIDFHAGFALIECPAL
jgi:sorbitol-specific phosphotransferase system component IIA